MKITKYKATIIGLIIAAICGLISLGAFFVPALSVISVVLFIPLGLPFEYISSWIFGENNSSMKLIGVLVMQIILLLVLSYWYFRKLILDKKKLQKFSRSRLLVFFLLLQVVIHPIVFYIWLLINPNMDPNDSMILFYMIKTLPFSGLVFIVLGVFIDLIGNWGEKENPASTLDS